jgi:hypothetical protein
MGYVDQLIVTDDGTKIAVHNSSGRIQIYDPQWKFQNCIHVDAGGGMFKARLTSKGTLDVWTVRGKHYYEFAANGMQLGKDTYTADYSSFPGSGAPGYVPTPWYLMPFSSPLPCGLMFGVGMLFSFLANHKEMKQRKPWNAKDIGMRLGKFFRRFRRDRE